MSDTVWTEAAVRELPVTIPITVAAAVLGIGRGSGYELARTGALPTLQLGRRKLVRRSDLLVLLGIETKSEAASPTETAAAPSVS